MLKVITPGSYDFDTSSTQLIKVSSRGLRGHDLNEFIKRAGHAFVDMVKKPGMVKEGEVPIHLIAIGATEFYGPNRNGDGFTESTCRDYHQEFKKNARWYRNHSNKNPSASYGLVKESYYNEKMHRIELFCVLNGTKEAAKRNGGLVADQELEKLAREEDIPVSMACLVPYDICSECGHQARNKKEYCTGKSEGGFCTRDGAKTALCKVYSDGRIHHVDNPRPKFFDISKVVRPADRIAYTMGKLASCASVKSGAEIAEELKITAPAMLSIDEFMPYKVAEQIKLAYELAAVEDSIENNFNNRLNLAFTKEASDRHRFNDAPSGLGVQLWSALAQSKVMLPLEGFLQLTTGDIEKSASIAPVVQAALPGVYGRMINDGTLTSSVENNLFTVNDILPNNKLRNWATKYSKDYSLDPNIVDKRIVKAAIYNPKVRKPAMIKMASNQEAIEQLARSYALYKLAALQYLQERDVKFDLTKELAIRQNYVS